jgi:hypothetical protein
MSPSQRLREAHDYLESVAAREAATPSCFSPGYEKLIRAIFKLARYRLTAGF